MPEGPELHLSSRFVNKSCKDRIFTGKVIKSDVHKSSEVSFEAKAYTICALSRGKEMQLILTTLLDEHIHSKPNSKPKVKPKIKTDPDDASSTTKILFRFGMSGKFEFTTPDKVHKHAHLIFFTGDSGSPMVLSHVDVRRFGRWEVNADWSKQRGPDPMFDYQNFRSNVLAKLDAVAFNQPICEVLLNQKYFNGIGNYLRAEILYRLHIPPFEKARTVLEGLSSIPPDSKPSKNGKKGKDDPDILHLCHTVPLEVVNIIGGGGYDPEGKATNYTAFSEWLQCYYQDGMSNIVDHNGRTIWYTGPAGPLVPKDGKSRGKRTKKRQSATKNDKTDCESTESPPKKLKGSIKPSKTPSTAKKARKSASRKIELVTNKKNSTQKELEYENTKKASRSRKKASPDPNGDVVEKKNVTTAKRRMTAKRKDVLAKQTPARKKRNPVSKVTPAPKTKAAKKKPTRRTTRTIKT